MELSKEQERFLDAAARADRSCLLLGKAGVGKSVCVRELVRRVEGKMSFQVLAPTGVAAINIGGSTIHRFLLLLGREYGVPRLLIIDEASMVRADLLDRLDKALQAESGSLAPFGGAAVVMIGDVAQLPPVVREEDKEALFAEYRSPWFFSAKSFAAVSWEKHELTTIFRQDDPHFVSLLNKIRVGEAREAVAWINENCQTTLARGTILVPTNKSAEKINLQQLDKLGGGTQTFRAAITGDFPENHYPTEPLVSLCVGARVMIVKNIYRKKEDSLSGEPVVELALVNGDTGLVLAVDRMSIRFRCDRTEEEYTVSTLDGHWEKKEKRDVEKIERVFDPVLQKEVDKAFVISEDVVVGSFEQLPVRLAWAITIHKAQGATLHEATIDFRRPMFADGQSYVALSRASSSKRLWVLGKMREKDVILSAEAQDFLEHGLESRYIYQPPSAQEVERVVQGALL